MCPLQCFINQLKTFHMADYPGHEPGKQINITLCCPIQTYQKKRIIEEEKIDSNNVSIWSDESSGRSSRRDLHTKGSCTRRLGMNF